MNSGGAGGGGGSEAPAWQIQLLEWEMWRFGEWAAPSPRMGNVTVAVWGMGCTKRTSLAGCGLRFAREDDQNNVVEVRPPRDGEDGGRSANHGLLAWPGLA
jgi:hypothetical protein